MENRLISHFEVSTAVELLVFYMNNHYEPIHSYWHCNSGKYFLPVL